MELKATTKTGIYEAQRIDSIAGDTKLKETTQQLEIRSSRHSNSAGRTRIPAATHSTKGPTANSTRWLNNNKLLVKDNKGGAQHQQTANKVFRLSNNKRQVNDPKGGAQHVMRLPEEDKEKCGIKMTKCWSTSGIYTHAQRITAKVIPNQLGPQSYIPLPKLLIAQSCFTANTPKIDRVTRAQHRRNTQVVHLYAVIPKTSRGKRLNPAPRSNLVQNCSTQISSRYEISTDHFSSTYNLQNSKRSQNSAYTAQLTPTNSGRILSSQLAVRRLSLSTQLCTQLLTHRSGQLAMVNPALKAHFNRLTPFISARNTVTAHNGADLNCNPKKFTLLRSAQVAQTARTWDGLNWNPKKFPASSA
ncbi:hypothetical protein F511_33312 [Dorcoceras hygrometricum]|uniref:Uncharacterized protein n=1 Tax=Dorcoceras hygrometricum TaxID=472368 RepID=A0A2Z7AEC3_9LAMI|nr:hypothetical protein F511_33312 [Dorcoceras hygrometricum]